MGEARSEPEGLEFISPHREFSAAEREEACAIHEVVIPAGQPCLQCVLENISGMKVRSTRQIIEGRWNEKSAT